jgi:hypothetical protein
MTSVLQDWVMELPLREQGTLLTAVRGCDLAPKYGTDGQPVDSMERRLTAWIRWAFMNPADPREVDIPGAFFQSRPPDPFKPSALGHYPLHWYSHVMHALEVVGYRHPDVHVRDTAYAMYAQMVYMLHLNIEHRHEMIERLSEDRLVAGTVVS